MKWLTAHRVVPTFWRRRVHSNVSLLAHDLLHQVSLIGTEQNVLVEASQVRVIEVQDIRYVILFPIFIGPDGSFIRGGRG